MPFPYKGYIYTLTTSAGYALGKTLNLSATYTFSEANYGENNAANGVPLGLNYNRHNLIFGVSKKINAHFSAALRYVFSSYTEPGTGGFNDYHSQGGFATLAYAWR